MRIAVAGGSGTVGRHVVDAAHEHGHDVVVLTRSTGADLVRGRGLAALIEGVDAVIDVSSLSTTSDTASKEFFGAVTTNLLDAERAAGIRHHLALSIVGSDKAPFAYYAGKALQEQLVSTGEVPWTILRATQFHEFAQQIYGQIKAGPVNLVPKMISQPIAAREVGVRLIELAEAGPSGRPADLAGPEVLRMADMVKAYAAATGGRGPILQLPLPGGFGKAMRDGTLIAGPGAQLGTQTFAQWVAALPNAKGGSR